MRTAEHGDERTLIEDGARHIGKIRIGVIRAFVDKCHTRIGRSVDPLRPIGRIAGFEIRSGNIRRQIFHIDIAAVPESATRNRNLFGSTPNAIGHNDTDERTPVCRTCPSPAVDRDDGVCVYIALDRNLAADLTARGIRPGHDLLRGIGNMIQTINGLRRTVGGNRTHHDMVGFIRSDSASTEIDAAHIHRSGLDTGKLVDINDLALAGTNKQVIAQNAQRIIRRSAHSVISLERFGNEQVLLTARTNTGRNLRRNLFLNGVNRLAYPVIRSDGQLGRRIPVDNRRCRIG